MTIKTTVSNTFWEKCCVKTLLIAQYSNFTIDLESQE